ncbi:MAG TPA: tetratricopeptide repeat protein, partial [Magnetococcales bacterium]|nr:tetratricopeptide repeat protein [Magnetococcales bacterium]
IQARPDYMEAYFNGGSLLQIQGQWDTALIYFSKALELHPNHPQILFHMGVLFQQQGKPHLAIQHYRQGLATVPDHHEVLNNLGRAYLDSGDANAAIQHLQKALDVVPAFPEAYNNLGIAWDTLGDRDQALDCFKKALQLKPDFPEALNNCGNMLNKRHQPELARDCFEEALRLRPDYPEACCNLSSSLHQLGQLQEALAMLQKASSISPNFPSIHYNESLIRLLLGEYTLGWVLFEWRWLSQDIKIYNHSQPLWDGSPLEGGTVLVHCEQGFGDSVQFIRYVQAVKSMVGKVVVLSPPPLERLFRTIAEIDTLVSQSDQIPPCGCQVPLMSLPLVLRTTLETIPANVPYLRADPLLVAHFQDRLGSRGNFKIGLAWRGNPRQKNDGNRSMDPQALRPLLEVPGCTFVNLQKDAAAADLQTFSGCRDFIDLSHELSDFAMTAALITHLDLVISVDTSIIHLTGALGRPGWVMLAAIPDWRWLLQRQDSPWYPTLRLLRQPGARQWDAVVNEIVVRLQAVLAGKMPVLWPLIS